MRPIKKCKGLPRKENCKTLTHPQTNIMVVNSYEHSLGYNSIINEEQTNLANLLSDVMMDSPSLF